jgi:tryptophan-rich sensory protein
MVGVSLGLGIAIAIPVVGGIITSNLTRESLAGWYPTLDKPALNPPGWFFGPVWAVLYTLMGIASYQVFHVTGFDWQSRALKLYATQLALNFLWPITFFNWRKLALSCLVNLALLTTAVATTGAFYKIRTEAGQLMLPYVVWLAFANLLNIGVWRRNPHANEVQPAGQQKPLKGEEYGPTGPAGKPAPSASMGAAPRRTMRTAAPRLQQHRALQAPRTLHTRLALRRTAVLPRAAAAPTPARALFC